MGPGVSSSRGFVLASHEYEDGPAEKRGEYSKVVHELMLDRLRVRAEEPKSRHTPADGNLNRSSHAF